MPDSQDIDGILERRLTAQVLMGDKVCDIPVHKKISGHQSRDLLGWDAAIRTADPEEMGCLLTGKARKETGLLGFRAAGPFRILVE
jgi:hypothetical protein